MRRRTYFVMALALVLGLAQCKKETIESQGEKVRITLNVDDGENNGTRANVTPPSVSFVNDDQILVASNGHYVGTLTASQSGDNVTFSGDITDPVEGEPLYFYFLGNEQGTLEAGATTCTVNISDQTKTNNKPVISMGKSTEDYASGTTSYTSRLYNKASLMKFTVITPSTAPICITGMNNEVTVNFNPKTANTDDGFTFGINTDDGGLIKMPAKGANNETWAIVLPQDEAITTPYSEDGYSGTSTTIHKIEANKYYNDAITMEVETPPAFDPLATPLTLEAVADGTITFSNSADNPVTYRINGGAEQTIPPYSGDVNIPVVAGDKVAFYATNSSYNGSHIMCSSDCYIYGNIMSLVKSTTYPTHVNVYADHALAYLFENNNHLINHPTKDLVMPATGLGDMCYTEMFKDCTGLTRAPELPATTLANMCYSGMFEGCTGLTTAPVLAATKLKHESYRSMFSGCSNLNSVTCLATDINALDCTTNWLNGVAATGTFYADPSATWSTGTDGIPTGWTRKNPDGSDWEEPVPTGAINSIFNVGTSASPKYVYFSEGNLQYSRSADKWSFMEHQYDMVETSGMNVGTNYADQDIVSLFGWGTGNNPTKTGGGAAEYENYTEWGTNTIYSGTTATTNWRTLTRDEWDNLFANHQYGYVMILNGSQWICGVAIDPSSTTTLNTSHSHWSNNMYMTGLDAFIADAEAGGWLFLPAAGLRTGTSVTNVSDPGSGAGYYWSSTKEYDSLLECYQSNYLLIKSNDDAMINRNLGFIGHSVRLVKDAN